MEVNQLFNSFWAQFFPAPAAVPVIEPLAVNAQGRELIQLAEGYSAVPYLCAAAVATIAYGATIALDANPITLDHPRINQPTGEQLFTRDLKLFSKSVRILVNVPINNNQFSALVSLTYNIGMGNFRASTLRRKLNRGDYVGCADEFWKWRRAKGKILKGLVIRREREKQLFLS